jgi:putative hydrolase of the HAD superfamily
LRQSRRCGDDAGLPGAGRASRTVRAATRSRCSGLAEIFEEIFDIVALGFRPKPDPATYRAVLARLGAEPGRAILLDDLARNLAPARDLGMRTVLVGPAAPAPVADFSIRTIRDLPAILPQLLA